jgi:hypothetical protein
MVKEILIVWLQATVDVISSSGWLNPALAAMELSQMVTQALWDRDSVLMQLPRVDKALAAKCAEAGVESIFELHEMEVRCRSRKPCSLSLLLSAQECRMSVPPELCHVLAGSGRRRQGTSYWA